MCPKSAQNPRYKSELAHACFSKSPAMALSNSYSIILVGASGALVTDRNTLDPTFFLAMAKTHLGKDLEK